MTGLFFSGIVSCRETDEGISGEKMKYAEIIRIEENANYSIAEISDPWNSGRLMQRYIMIPEDITGNEYSSILEDMPEGIILRTPLRKVAVFTGTHCSIMELLQSEKSVCGVCEPQYIRSEYVQKGIKDGTVADYGNSQYPSIEKIVEDSPDAVFLSSFAERNVSDKLSKAGIPVIECADYMETHPLARSEWIKFFGILFDRKAMADSVFAASCKRYEEICAEVASAHENPRLMVEKKIASAWYVPGGKSYTAKLYADAGADYLWKDNNETGSIPLSFETVLEKAEDADIWLIKYNDPEYLTRENLRREFDGYSRFRPYEKGSIYACNAFYNNYFDEIVTHPEYVLEDLAALFHPEMYPDHRFRYFIRMK